MHVAGQVIRTTAEHPFYVKDHGWTAAGELRVGDLLASHDSQWVPVEDLLNTGQTETVYNLRVTNYRTYFVGGREWGFSVWVHNLYGPHKIGNIAEHLASDKLRAKGWTPIASLSHGRNGIDIVAQKRLRNGVLKTIVAEVKGNGGQFSVVQRKGAHAYALDVLSRLGNRNLAPGARQAADILQEMVDSGETIRGVHIRFDWRSGTLIESLAKWQAS
jgi:intein/homing endonuclease